MELQIFELTVAILKVEKYEEKKMKYQNNDKQSIVSFWIILKIFKYSLYFSFLC